MTTRTRRNWRPDSRGYFSRQIGWKRSKAGKLQQHKFLLGTNQKEAEPRARKLRELWDSFAVACDEDRPQWPDDLLIIAKRIAKGIPEIPIPRGPSERQHTYAARIQRMQAKYPVILFLPEDQHAFEIGQCALEMFEAIACNPEDLTIRAIDADVTQAVEDAQKRLAEAGLTLPAELASLSSQANDNHQNKPLFGALKPGDPAVAAARPTAHKSSLAASPARSTNGTPAVVQSRTPLATLHQAMKAYQKYLEKEYFRPDLKEISPWGHTQVRQVKNLMKHHADCLLTNLDADAVSELVGYWRRRPCKRDTNKPMTAQSTSNFLNILTRFLKWLDTSSQFDWNKPFAFSDMDTRIRRLPSDLAKKSLEQVETFSLDELKLLMRYGQPMDRLLLLLGLNCGFGRAEIASLLVGEARLFEAHTTRQQEILAYKTTDQDSFIKRIRRKSGVYGEHILFPITVKGIQWALDRRKEFPGFSKEARLVLNNNGTPLDKQTKNGNANQIIPNHFGRLIRRIQSDDNEIRSLSFGKLRKTASDLIKRFSDGEIAGVFDCHGTPVKSDSLSDQYTNRPFGKVFMAIREVERYLAPVFAAAGPRPFAPQPKAHTTRSTIDRMVQLYLEGYPVGQIAKAVGVAGETASRHIRRYMQDVEAAAPTSS